MSATPVIPGLLYRVKNRNFARYIWAAHPIDALQIALKREWE